MDVECHPVVVTHALKCSGPKLMHYDASTCFKHSGPNQQAAQLMCEDLVESFGAFHGHGGYP